MPRISGYGLLLLTLLLFMQPVLIHAQDTSEDELEFNPTGALIRSAVIPGWGQLYTRHYLKSAGFFTAHAYFIYRFHRENQELQETTGEQAREQQQYHRNTWAWRLLAAYVLNLTDAYVDAHLSGFPEEGENISVRFLPGRGQLNMQLEIMW